MNRFKDFASAAFAWTCAFVVVYFAALLICTTLAQGAGEISWAFLVEEPSDAGRSGGIGPIIVSTFLILVICLGVSLPLGLGTAFWLSELANKDSWFAYIVRRSLDVLAGVPSIVFGLFGNALFCQLLGLGYSVLSGGLTLACMILPILIRMTEQGIRAVPDEYRLGAAALGLSKFTTLFRVLAPAAVPSIAAGIVLGVGRAMAETAALVFTSGYVTRTPESIFDSGRSLSVHVYDLAMNVPGGNERAFASATVLVFLLLVINGITVILTSLASQSSVARVDLTGSSK